MVLKITVDTGAEYILDKDLMNWQMYIKRDDETGVAGYRQGGRLRFWPEKIVVGKRMQIFKKEDSMNNVFWTGTVIKIDAIRAASPEVVEDEG